MTPYCRRPPATHILDLAMYLHFLIQNLGGRGRSAIGYHHIIADLMGKCKIDVQLAGHLSALQFGVAD